MKKKISVTIDLKLYLFLFDLSRRQKVPFSVVVNQLLKKGVK